jgi:hypothetical protein
VIDIDEDEADQRDIKPDNKDQMKVRLNWLEVRALSIPLAVDD